MLMTTEPESKTASAEGQVSAIELARSISQRDDYNLRLPGDHFHWENSAKTLAKALLALIDDKPVAIDEQVGTKKTYTAEERLQARVVLGYRTPDDKLIPLEERSVENLILMIQNLRETADDRHAQHKAEIKALDDRLRSARNAKHFANRRADVAEQAMRKLQTNFTETLDAFKSLEQK